MNCTADRLNLADELGALLRGFPGRETVEVPRGLVAMVVDCLQPESVGELYWSNERCCTRHCDGSVKVRTWPTNGDPVQYYCGDHTWLASHADRARQLVMDALGNVEGLGEAEAEAMVADLLRVDKASGGL